MCEGTWVANALGGSLSHSGVLYHTDQQNGDADSKKHCNVPAQDNHDIEETAWKFETPNEHCVGASVCSMGCNKRAHSGERESLR